MRLMKGDMWSSKADCILVTANSTINQNGELVMGRGAAAELKIKYPSCAKIFADLIRPFPGPTEPRDFMRRSYVVHDCRYGVIQIRLSGPQYQSPTYRGILQVKTFFRANASKWTIEYSISQLNTLALGSPGWTWAVNFPGIGYGGLLRSEVMPLLCQVPDNVEVWEY